MYESITTTNGEEFTYSQSAELAHMVFVRFGRCYRQATDAWNRMMQTNCDAQEYMMLVEHFERWGKTA